MDKTVNLRIKCKAGQQILKELPLSLTVEELKEKLHLLTGISPPCMRILHGYPPQLLDLSCKDALLGTLNLRSGDTLIIEQDSIVATASSLSNGVESGAVIGDQVGKTSSDQMADTAPPRNLISPSDFSSSLYADTEQGILTRKMVPANNSCLFTAIDYVMNGGRSINLTAAQPMRQLVARLVSGNRETYSEGFLGRQNSDYCTWILNDKSWGGAIEVSILSKHYEIEIDVIDAQSGRINRFGETEQYDQRVFLFYDGTHYDPVVYENVEGTAVIRTKFSTTSTADIAALAQALEIAEEAKASRQFTDMHAGMMQCKECGAFLRGESEVVKHSKDTKHVQFSQVQ